MVLNEKYPQPYSPVRARASGGAVYPLFFNGFIGNIFFFSSTQHSLLIINEKFIYIVKNNVLPFFCPHMRSQTSRNPILEFVYIFGPFQV